MTDLIIGIDCATQPRRMGLARAVRERGRYRVVDLHVCDGHQHPVEVVAGWVGREESALLAMDVPLGWPSALGRELSSHAAGDPLMVPGDLLFRRLTDRVVAQRTGKTPLDVGADRIARTAHSALLFLNHLRKELNEPVPLAWEGRLQQRVEAIEVYPAATMLARGASLRGYKKAEAIAERARLLEFLRASVDCDGVKEAALANHDCLDAVACVVAGVDFLDGTVVEPREPELARQEGWIWFRETGRRTS